MSNAMRAYLKELGEQPGRRLAFARDREAALAESGLGFLDRAALASGQQAAIYRCAGANPVEPPKIIYGGPRRA